MKKRYLVPHILKDLDEKMVFIGGARQVGKTCLARYIAENYFKSHDYLNWDSRDDRKKILRSEFKGDAEIVLFDEIRKYKDWKNYLKGQFDKHKDNFNILVTGSARLDVYRRGGDSLMGRYYYYRLHPFSLAEFFERVNEIVPFKEIVFLESSKETREAGVVALKFGGFPEPLLKMCHFLNDVDGYKADLHFLRDVEGREVDFLVTENGKPWFAVEVKTTSKEVSKNLSYFGNRLEIPFLYQVVSENDVDIRKDSVRIISLDRFLVSLV